MTSDGQEENRWQGPVVAARFSSSTSVRVSASEGVNFFFQAWSVKAFQSLKLFSIGSMCLLFGFVTSDTLVRSHSITNHHLDTTFISSRSTPRFD